MQLIKFLLRLFFSLLFIGIFIICLGLPVYYFNIASAPTNNKEKTDAIIVLTGGKERIPEGIRLLNEGLADKLLISGVDKSTKATELLDALSLSLDEIKKTDLKKVLLGRQAVDTIGNAEETASWVSNNNIKSIRLVTANYHMPRAHLEFRKKMPKLAIVENPVFPHDFRKQDWQENKATRDLIIKEYFKYLYRWLELGKL